VSTKVEQLVMGAFWEAARRAHQQESFGRIPLDEVEVVMAHHIASWIRAYGVSSLTSSPPTEARP
jgi:hypothetical protein